MNNLNTTIEHNRKTHDKVSKFYNIKHTEIYNKYEQDRLEKTIINLLSLLETKSKKLVVLDYGAGTGNLSRLFSKHGCKVIATDISPESLRRLEQNYKDIETVVFDGKRLPFEDNVLDVVALYSVLHHIPDYKSAVKEMFRVLKKGGYVYIDHEANYNRWFPSVILQEYNSLTKHTLAEYLFKLIRTKEIFTYDFYKCVFIKTFINKRYEREGDIHVWKDDHIEWENLFAEVSSISDVIVDHDYLLYKPKISLQKFSEYENKCTDTKYVFLRKK